LRESAVLRATLGGMINVERGLKLKVSGELWRWTEKDANNRNFDVGVHAGVIGMY
jgi:hypothetical protein